MAGRKKGRLPKRVLGMKIPKELRKAGDRLLEKANTPQGREAIGGVLTMAAAAATAALAKGREAKAAPAPQPAPAPAPAAAEPAGATNVPPQGTQRSPDPEEVVDALGQMANQVMGRLFGTR